MTHMTSHTNNIIMYLISSKLRVIQFDKMQRRSSKEQLACGKIYAHYLHREKAETSFYLSRRAINFTHFVICLCKRVAGVGTPRAYLEVRGTLHYVRAGAGGLLVSSYSLATHFTVNKLKLSGLACLLYGFRYNPKKVLRHISF